MAIARFIDRPSLLSSRSLLDDFPDRIRPVTTGK
jgi:hypothetical protein